MCLGTSDQISPVITHMKLTFKIVILNYFCQILSMQLYIFLPEVHTYININYIMTQLTIYCAEENRVYFQM